MLVHISNEIIIIEIYWYNSEVHDIIVPVRISEDSLRLTFQGKRGRR